MGHGEAIETFVVPLLQDLWFGGLIAHTPSTSRSRSMWNASAPTRDLRSQQSLAPSINVGIRDPPTGGGQHYGTEPLVDRRATASATQDPLTLTVIIYTLKNRSTTHYLYLKRFPKIGRTFTCTSATKSKPKTSLVTKFEPLGLGAAAYIIITS